MSASQRVSRGFHRVGLVLAALLVATPTLAMDEEIDPGEFEVKLNRLDLSGRITVTVKNNSKVMAESVHVECTVLDKAGEAVNTVTVWVSRVGAGQSEAGSGNMLKDPAITSASCRVMSAEAVKSQGPPAGVDPAEVVFSVAQLLDACTRADYEGIGFCNGYLQAALDATGGKGICFPSGHSRNDVYDAIIPKLQKSPGVTGVDAISVIQALLRDAYPCN